MVLNGFSESTLLYILLIAAKKCPVIEAIRTRLTHVMLNYNIEAARYEQT